MKSKWILSIILFCSIVVFIGNSIVYAASWKHPDYSMTDYAVWFDVNITPGVATSTYDFVIDIKSGSISIIYVAAVDSNGNEKEWCNGSSFSTTTNGSHTYKKASYTVDNDVDIEYFKVYFAHSVDSFGVVYELNSSMKYLVTPTPTPTIAPTATNTPIPTVTSIPEPTATSTPKPSTTNTPVPTATSTPVPTATNTPKPTATNTPKPTPTNTPTPTLVPTPVLELKVWTSERRGAEANAEYYTGGHTPKRSGIEFYEVNDALDIKKKISSERFISGSGNRHDAMEVGKTYRYYLYYIYECDGVEYFASIWSEDLTIVDEELEHYKRTKKIYNFRTLILYFWENIATLKIDVDGYEITYKQWLVWIFVAMMLVYFFRKYFGD